MSQVWGKNGKKNPQIRWRAILGLHRLSEVQRCLAIGKMGLTECIYGAKITPSCSLAFWYNIERIVAIWDASNG
jgi:hypothetical protein